MTSFPYPSHIAARVGELFAPRLHGGVTMNQSSEEPVPCKWQYGWIRVLRHFGYIRSASPTDVVVDDQDLNYRLAAGLRDLFDSDSDSNKNTHLCHDVFSPASICYVH